jgi:transcriptional regulator MraZ
VLFTGHSEHTIDAKQRLAIPAKYRSQWKESTEGKAWICVPWPGGVLRLYPEKTFELLADAQAQTLTPASDEADLEADLFGFAERIEMDKTGRISLPRSHLDLVALTTDVVVVGARNRLEVRDRTKWLASRAERFARLPSLVERIETSRRTQP